MPKISFTAPAAVSNGAKSFTAKAVQITLPDDASPALAGTIS